MSAATKPINTPERPGVMLAVPAAADAVIFAGTLVALDSSGNAVPAADTAGLRVVGLAQASIDNTGGSAGDVVLDVKRGVFKFANSATNAVDADDKGKLCVVEDDNTVAETSTNKIVAGRVVDVESDGVWVQVGMSPVSALVATTVGAAIADISGGESPTEAEFITATTRINQLRVDVLALAALLNA
ncbi:hypothetical protein ASA1KI_21220 [Opitutales bacterium ASA1]|uniref:hypothetical protein n=1 Tax=Congregicoccus parvus TaxID=3081749 RepID=UPI002B30375A|nr:hypothetical protein ASA1KI_21220 [Opitutales bacterium ASA1]